MRKLMGCVIAAAALMALPQLALAQRARAAGTGGAKNEIGVDLGAAYSHEGSGCPSSCGFFGVGTPVDVRWGFVANGPLSFEPRFTLNYLTGGGGHTLSFDPDVNVLYRMGTSTARKGMYLTGGLGLSILNDKSPLSTTSTTVTQFGINGGVGTRIPMESNAWRIEGFLRYDFENKGKAPSSFAVGARFGMSFWR